MLQLDTSPFKISLKKNSPMLELTDDHDIHRSQAVHMVKIHLLLENL